MTTAELAMVFTARDRASGPIRKIGANVKTFTKQVDSMNKAASRIGTVLGVGATGLGLLAAKTGVSFNILKENATLAFTTLLKDGGKAQAMIAQIEETAKKTPFGFEDLTRASQRLLAFGFAADDVIPILTTVGDAVSAMGGGAEMIDRVTMALGQMQTKGKVSGEEMMQLAEAGIPAWQILAENVELISPAMAEAVKAGKLTQQQVIQRLQKMGEAGKLKAGPALAALRKGMALRFGGLGEKQAKTTAGATSALSDALQQLFGALSEGPLKTITGWMLVLAVEVPKITEAFKNLSEPVRWVIGAFAGAVLAISTLLIAIGGAGGLLALLGAPGLLGVLGTVAGFIGTVVVGALAILLTPLGLLVLAVTALALAWSHNWFGIRDITATVVKWLGNRFDDLVRAAADLTRGVGDALRDGWTYVVSLFSWLASTAGTVLAAGWEYVVSLFQWVSDTVTPIVAALAEAVGAQFQALVDTVSGVLAGGWAYVVSLFAWLDTAASPVVAALAGYVVSTFRWLTDTAGAVLARGWEYVVTLFRWLSDTVTPIVAGAWSWVIDRFAWLVTGAGSIIDAGWHWVVDLFAWLGDTVIRVIGGAWTHVVSVFTWLKDVASSSVEWLVNRVVQLFTWMGDRIRDIWGPIQALIDKARNIGGAVGGAIGGVVTIVGNNLPRLAEGGIATSPTLAMIGEAGPEAVVPLGRGGFGGGALTININAPVYGVNQLEDVIRRAIDRSRQRGGVG